MQQCFSNKNNTLRIQYAKLQENCNNVCAHALLQQQQQMHQMFTSHWSHAQILTQNSKFRNTSYFYSQIRAELSDTGKTCQDITAATFANFNGDWHILKCSLIKVDINLIKTLKQSWPYYSFWAQPQFFQLFGVHLYLTMVKPLLRTKMSHRLTKSAFQTYSVMISGVKR
jgi:hypothetical protein